ncbi:hypothetical protein JBL43_16490 [Aureibaculum sp. A20]|uniref:Receptor L-domain domain-containing protein n=1 Tax=Aureibaculum flavum TaxID=2795986 RepID=A0ABS0WV47_9FLAO|nr:hypothetical protein [Aureibaculum flavum]MBJ2175854.1 hypothetical protein [Aureibaculum flavum]
MKIYKLIIIVIILFNYGNAQAQKIWVGDLITENLEEFHSGKYTEVEGAITIDNYEENNLEVLKNLEKCTGDVNISNNEKLISLQGLENLQFVGGKFSIIKNPDLYNYCALQKTLVKEGIRGEEISKDIYDKWNTEDNGFNPSLMNLQNENCSTPNLKDLCFSC